MLPLLLVLACHCAAPPRPPEAPATPRSAAPEGVLVDLMGINEGVVVPRLVAARIPAAERAELIDQALEWVRWLGVRQLRVHSATYPFLSQYGQESVWGGDPAVADAYLIQLLDAGMEPLVMLGPWPGNHPGEVAHSCLPADVPSYVQWVVRTVERYDGDGVEDAPGLPRGIHLWEVDNEPDHHNLTTPPVGSYCPPEDFSSLVQLTAGAIREADPHAVVLPGGLLRPLSDDGAAYGQLLWSQPGFADTVSGLDLHGYPNKAPADLWRGVDRVAPAAAGEPLWITETSTQSLGRHASERSQASDLASIWLEAVRRGTTRVYWHSLAEKPTILQGPRQGPGAMTEGRHLLTGGAGDVEERWGIRHFSSLHPKLAAWTLRALQRRYGALDRAQTGEIEVEGGLGVHLGEALAVYSLRPMSLSGEVRVSIPWEGEVYACGLVPEGARGPEVDAPPTWPEARLPVLGGEVRVDLRKGPVVLRATPCDS